MIKIIILLLLSLVSQKYPIEQNTTVGGISTVGEVLWLFVRHFGCLWGTLAACEALWLFVRQFGCLCGTLAVCVALWLLVRHFGCLWCTLAVRQLDVEVAGVPHKEKTQLFLLHLQYNNNNNNKQTQGIRLPLFTINSLNIIPKFMFKRMLKILNDVQSWTSVDG